MKNHKCSPNIIHAHVCECWIEEFQQLKRIKENIDNRIKAYKTLLALNSGTQSYSEQEIAEIDDKIILLESLDK